MTTPALGELAVQEGLLDVPRLQALLERQRQGFAQGRFRRLGELLVEQRVCKPDAVVRLLARQGLRLGSCELCGRRYGILGPGQPSCPCCGRQVRPTPGDDRLQTEDTLVAPGSEPLLAAWRQRNPARLGSYGILGEIGRGAMGVVYKAWDAQGQRLTALKFLLEPEGQPWETVERFRREGQVLEGLRHPSIVGVQGLREQDGLLALALDYIPGVPLSVLLRRGMLTPEQVVGIGAAIADALACAHAAGVVHRDVKPENVVVDATLHPVLIDFGVVKDAGESMSLTMEGEVLGSLAYMAPEYVTQGIEALDAGADVYGLGIVLYRALAHDRWPYGDPQDEDQMIARLVAEEPEPLARHAPDLPPAVAEVVMRAIAKDPARRTPDAATLALDLRRLLGG